MWLDSSEVRLQRGTASGARWAALGLITQTSGLREEGRVSCLFPPSVPAAFPSVSFPPSCPLHLGGHPPTPPASLPVPPLPPESSLDLFLLQRSQSQRISPPLCLQPEIQGASQTPLFFRHPTASPAQGRCLMHSVASQLPGLTQNPS